MSCNSPMETVALAELGAAPRQQRHRCLRQSCVPLGAVFSFLFLLLLGFIAVCIFVFRGATSEKSETQQFEPDGNGSISVRRLLLAQQQQQQQQPQEQQQIQFAEFALDTESATNCQDGGGGAGYPCWNSQRYVALNHLGRLRQLDGGNDGFVLADDRRQIRLLRGGVFAIDAQVRVTFEDGSLTLQGHIEVNGKSNRLFCEERVLVLPGGNSLKQQALTLTCRLSGYLRLQAGDLVEMRLNLFGEQAVLTGTDSTFIRLVRLG